MEAAHTLPVWAGKDKIVQRIRDNDTVILVGETGSGKTTQVPQFLLREGILPSEGQHMIGITQPRRVAATSLARRVASELGCADPATLKEKQEHDGLPEWVGYSVRFDDRTTRHTRIKFLTDGMLIREILGPLPRRRGKPERNFKETNEYSLKRYSVLIIDEAHERSLRTDMVLGLAKRIQRDRRNRIEAGEANVYPLKIVVMSATIDAERFAQFFSHGQPVPILYVAGRQHGVRLYHTEASCQDWTDAAVRTMMQIHVSKPLGDILVFATGQEEIEAMAQSLKLYAAQLDAWAEEQGRDSVPTLLIRPLYAALGPSASAAVFAPTPKHTRKVVLATNIAETSITIPGVRYVVDSGLVKEKVFSPQTHVETLQVLPVSQSSSLQRAGRAGREGPGECYRLYTREAFQELQLQPTSEIHRTELSGAALQLYAMGLDPFTFDWIEPPATSLLHEAVLQLAELGAVDSRKDTVQLTPLGQRLAALPVTPSYARLLLAAAERGPEVASQARDLVSILSADRGLFVDVADPEKREAAESARDQFVDTSGDHATLLNALRAYLLAQQHAFQSHSTPAAARQELKMWCQTHAIHERTVKNVLAIRKQLIRICLQHGIECADDATKSAAAPDDGESESDDDALIVTRYGASSTRDHEQSYADLLQCLGMGRLSHVALRQPDGSFRRIAGGQSFKLHPTCVLHPSRHGARGISSDSVQAIVFEELVMTSQTFARTVSKLEPVWLQALLAAS
ncbi:RNA helicase [Malassezia caprae]|uniref:RNA helicase n=1 Tax=Malassezia caprae TaxID=1381934 RepID=A0AAF0EAE0_9BASI|nr:RNA helicase [Malassezia caprae]